MFIRNIFILAFDISGIGAQALRFFFVFVPRSWYQDPLSTIATSTSATSATVRATAMVMEGLWSWLSDCSHGYPAAAGVSTDLAFGQYSPPWPFFSYPSRKRMSLTLTWSFERTTLWLCKNISLMLRRHWLPSQSGAAQLLDVI